MKRFLTLTTLVVLVMATFSCANYQKMVKNADLVKAESSPEILECVNNQINSNYTITFPKKYFLKKAILKVTPTMVFDNSKIEYNDLWLQGEKVTDNNHVVNYKEGDSFTRQIVIPYKEGMEKSTLELRATVYNKNKTKSYKFPIPYKIAEGVNCTYMLANKKGVPTFEKDNYQKEYMESYETQILYEVNRAEVRNSRLNSKEIKEFEEFLKETKNDNYKEIESSTIIGYASPEGPEKNNNSLSDKRAKSAKVAYDKTIAKRAKLDVPVSVEERGEDWEGFKNLVEASDIEDKDLIIRVLSMYSDPVVREREIRNMSAVFQTLSNKVLPQLRRSRIVANIKTTNFSDEELKSMTAQGDERLDEEAYLYYATIVKDKNEKIELYKKAVDLFKSNRALNNLSAIMLLDGNVNKANEYLNKVSEKNGAYFNNMGVAELQKGNFEKAKQYFEESANDEARDNIGTIQLLTGDYKNAVKNLSGKKTHYNYPLALILNGKLDEARKELQHENCPYQSYLRAIIAARKGDKATCEKELEKVSKNKELANRIENDIEFAFLR